MLEIEVGLAAFERSTIWRWEALLAQSSEVRCTVLAHYSYGEPAGEVSRVVLGAGGRQVWLIDVPLPQLFPADALGWLRGLCVPAVLVCGHPQVARQLSECGARLPLIAHPAAIAQTSSTAALLALAASTVAGGPLYLGLAP